MERIIPGTLRTFTTSVTGPDGLPADAPEITYSYKITYGFPQNVQAVSVTPVRTGLGEYAVTYVIPRSGWLYQRWDTNGELDAAQERPVRVFRSAFAENVSCDYN